MLLSDIYSNKYTHVKYIISNIRIFLYLLDCTFSHVVMVYLKSEINYDGQTW